MTSASINKYENGSYDSKHAKQETFDGLGTEKEKENRTYKLILNKTNKIDMYSEKFQYSITDSFPLFTDTHSLAKYEYCHRIVDNSNAIRV